MLEEEEAMGASDDWGFRLRASARQFILPEQSETGPTILVRIRFRGGGEVVRSASGTYADEESSFGEVCSGA
jgi:hypothetical protein